MTTIERIEEAVATLTEWGTVTETNGAMAPVIRRASDVTPTLGSDGGETVYTYADAVVVKRSWGPDVMYTPCNTARTIKRKGKL